MVFMADDSETSAASGLRQPGGGRVPEEWIIAGLGLAVQTFADRVRVSPGRVRKTEQLRQGHTTVVLLHDAHTSGVRSGEEPLLRKLREAPCDSNTSRSACP